MTRHPRARPPSPYATTPTGPRWYAQVAEYRRGAPTLGVDADQGEPEPKIAKGEQ